MKKIIMVLLATILVLALFVGCGKTVDSSWQEEIEKNAAANKYTLLFINDGNSSDAKDTRANTKAIVDDLSAQFSLVDVDYSIEKDNILAYFNISAMNEFPVAISITPSGLITGSFTKQCTKDDLMSTIVSEKEDEIFLSLQKGLVVLLCVYNDKQEDLDTTKEYLDTIEANYGGAVAAHYLDTTYDVDKEFVSMLPEVTGDITVMVVVPSTGIGAILTDEEITLTNILSAIQSSCSSGSCGTGGCG